MKKLRLIKPWQLRTVRQRLVNDCDRSERETEGWGACVAPTDSGYFAATRHVSEGRLDSINMERIFFTGKAPVSNIIFASANIRQ